MGVPLRQIIDGHMTVTRVMRTRHRHDNYTFVNVLVYEGDKEEGRPVSDWEFPYTFRYDLDGTAQLAVKQTKFGTQEGTTDHGDKPPPPEADTDL